MITELVHRGVYRIRGSKYLTLGVWDEGLRGFIGPRFDELGQWRMLLEMGAPKIEGDYLHPLPDSLNMSLRKESELFRYFMKLPEGQVLLEEWRASLQDLGLD